MYLVSNEVLYSYRLLRKLQIPKFLVDSKSFLKDAGKFFSIEAHARTARRVDYLEERGPLALGIRLKGC